jgi:hypothetical protein
VEDLLLAKNRFFPLADADSAGGFRGKKYTFTQPDWSTVVAGSQPQCGVDEAATHQPTGSLYLDQVTNPGCHRKQAANGERPSYTNTNKHHGESDRELIDCPEQFSYKGNIGNDAFSGSDATRSKRFAPQDDPNLRIGRCGTEIENASNNQKLTYTHTMNSLNDVQPREEGNGQPLSGLMEEEGEDLAEWDLEVEVDASSNVSFPKLSGEKKKLKDLGEDEGVEMLIEGGGNPSQNFPKKVGLVARSTGGIMEEKPNSRCGRTAEAEAEAGAAGMGAVSSSSERQSAPGGQASGDRALPSSPFEELRVLKANRSSLERRPHTPPFDLPAECMNVMHSRNVELDNVPDRLDSMLPLTEATIMDGKDVFAKSLPGLTEVEIFHDQLKDASAELAVAVAADLGLSPVGRALSGWPADFFADQERHTHDSATGQASASCGAGVSPALDAYGHWTAGVA